MINNLYLVFVMIIINTLYSAYIITGQKHTLCVIIFHGSVNNYQTR